MWHYHHPSNGFARAPLKGCLTLISVEMCHGLTKIDDRAFCDCYGLKNIAIPDTAEVVGESVVTMRMSTTTFDDEDATDGDEEEDDDHPAEDPLVRSLRKRFQDLPTHHLCYFFHPLYPDYDGMDEKNIFSVGRRDLPKSGQFQMCRRLWNDTLASLGVLGL